MGDGEQGEGDDQGRKRLKAELLILRESDPSIMYRRRCGGGVPDEDMRDSRPSISRLGVGLEELRMWGRCSINEHGAALHLLSDEYADTD